MAAEMCAMIDPSMKIFLLSDTQAEEDVQKLRRLDMYKDIVIDNPYRLSIGQYRDRLDARAIALSEDDSATVMINSLDHLVFVGRDNNGRIESAYATVRRLVDDSGEWLKTKDYDMAFHPKFGYMTVMPEMLGTATSINARLSHPMNRFLRSDMLMAEMRTMVGNAGLIMSSIVDQRDGSGYVHYDVESKETFFKGASGFEIESAVGHFSNALMKIREQTDTIRF